jgi:hypothetical protein
LFCSTQVLTGNSDGTTVNDITLQNAVETKYVKITVVGNGGSGNRCMRIELYATGKWTTSQLTSQLTRLPIN